VIVLISAVSPLATDAYLSAWPALQRSLHTSAAVAQLSLTAFLVGFAAGQLVLGSVSDGTGRRSVLVASTAAFALSTLACAVAPSGPALAVLRLVEGVAAGGAAATVRAVVSDHYEGREAAELFGTISSVMLLAPVLAPPIGTAIVAFGSWRTVFAMLAIVGCVMVVGVVACVPSRCRRPPGTGRASARRGRVRSTCCAIAATCATSSCSAWRRWRSSPTSGARRS
jgi:DHA1 family bicyclomycin/chloramphenicol resistance-like MFS transporter